jgi:hypothetical protein
MASELTTDDVARAVATLAALRSKGASLANASRVDPKGFLVCAQSAHGKVKTSTPNQWTTDRMTPAGLDLWGLGYRVVGGTSDYQRSGVIWGFARSYADAQVELQAKARAGVNGSARIVPGSLYTVPGYLVAKADYPELRNALEVAYRAWVAPSDVVGGWPPPAVGDSSEVTDAFTAVEELTSPRRNLGRRRLTAAENRAIEERAVQVTREHFETRLGYATEDVGLTQSYDLHATKGREVIKVEVKGTTGDGSRVVLTRNEVNLHQQEHPNNGLAVVRCISLERGETPMATGGELILLMPWEINPTSLNPIAYDYQTGV